MPIHHEAAVTIAGHALTSAQAMTVRVACTLFQMQLTDPEFVAGMGRMADGYRQHLQEIMKLIMEGEQ